MSCYCHINAHSSFFMWSSLMVLNGFTFEKPNSYDSRKVTSSAATSKTFASSRFFNIRVEHQMLLFQTRFFNKHRNEDKAK